MPRYRDKGSNPRAAGIAAAFIFSLSSLASTAFAYEGSRFQDVWAATKTDPYQILPEEKVTLGSFYFFLRDKLQEASERTLDNRSDVLPPFRRLLHPNGICFAGTWTISEKNPYSGFFRQGSQGLIIFRASAALSEIRRGEKRSFGVAGKIFPTMDPRHTQKLRTANFFAIDNLGGTYADSLLETGMTNDVTAIDFGFETLDKTGILAAATKAFSLSELRLGNRISVRQLHEISELGESDLSRVLTPQWLKIEGEAAPLNRSEDFRNELRLAANDGELRFRISVGSEGSAGGEKVWQDIGSIVLKDEALGKGCDQRLHFHHPIWRNDLNHGL